MPQNPLDILAQQTVAACALGRDRRRGVVRDGASAARRSARCPRSAYEATLDLLAGRFPSDEFAELRPRLVWDRDAGTLTGRPGAQRIAVTSGGTIPDRGLFGVFVAGESHERARRRARRGDGLRVARRRRVHARHDELADRRDHARPRQRPPRVRAAGQGAVLARRRHRPTRRAGRGARASSRATCRPPRPRRPRSGCARRASTSRRATNLLAYLAEQREATGTLPTDTHAHGRARSRRGRRLARDPAFPVRHEGARAVGAGRQRAHPRAPGRRGVGGRERRRHHRAGAGCRRPSRRAPSCSCSSPTSSSRSSPTRSAGRRCSPRASASAPRAPC